MQDGDHAEHPVVHNKVKEPIVSENKAPTKDELSFGRSPSMSPLLGRTARGNARAKSQRKHLHRPILSDVVNGAYNRAREQADMRQHQTPQAPRNVSVLPDDMMMPMHPAFDARLTFYA